MRASDRTTLSVMLSVILATLTVSPLTSDTGVIGTGWLLILLLGVVSIGLRRIQVGAGAVLAVQVLVLGGFVFFVSSTMPGQPPWYSHLAELWESGVAHMQTQSAPMAPDAGVRLIFIAVVGAIAVLTDLLVVGLGRPALGIVPPATLFLVPAVGLGTDTGVVPFACIALGYLGILLADGMNTTARWTRGLSRDTADGYGTAASVVWRAAGLIGGPALALTLVLGLALPTLALPGFGFGSGPGRGGPLQLSDPTLDLRRNLNQASDAVVIQYSSEKPGGVYLRLASLPEFNSTGWHNVQMQLSSGQRLPPIPGLGREPAERRRTSIRVLDFGSEYLPLPYAPRVIEAPGDWAYDANSLVVLAGSRRDRNDAIRNLTYTTESVDIAPSGSDLAGAVPGTPADATVTRELPEDLPESLRELTLEVTEDAETPVAKAAAIQEYLRGPDFTYSTEPLPGSGYRALENFLLDDRRGYCEQFAGAMAMMARVIGIPSRVAVGFLPGERRGETWEVSIRDMHAWPELFFAGYGWVRFEPTPASVTGSAPAWTRPPAEGSDDDSDDGASAQPSASAPSTSAGPENLPTQLPTDLGADGGFPWQRTLVGALSALVVLVILAAPATIRVRRRTVRLSGEGPTEEQVESAWAEIRDTVVDHGGSWPDGSPRAIGQAVGGRLDKPEAASMSQVATLVERARYSRGLGRGDGDVDLASMTSDIRRGIAAPKSRGRRLLAVLVPRSLFRRSR